MRILRRNMLYGLLASAGMGRSLNALHAHPHVAHPGGGPLSSSATPRGARADRAPGISGQGEMRFRILYTSDHLPPEARKVLVNAHGGFAVDRRAGKEETYFALPGAGILTISSDLKTISLIDTPDEMRNLNLHDTTIWYDPDGTPYLTFPANDAGRIFTTTLDGKLVNALDAPTAAIEFEHPEIRDYFLGGGNFAPTAVEFLNGLYYITTGYCNLDYVLTARINRENRSKSPGTTWRSAERVRERASSEPPTESPCRPAKCGSTSPTGRIPAWTVLPATATTSPVSKCLPAHCPATSTTWTSTTAWFPPWMALTKRKAPRFTFSEMRS